MEITMQTEYKGYVIKWDDWDKEFGIYRDDIEVKKRVPKLEDCQKWIDQKEKQKFKRVPILHKFGYRDDPIRAGEATSIVEDDYVWIVSSEGMKDREKERMCDVWIDNPENRQAVENITGMEKQIEALESEIEKIKKTTIRLTPEMMKEEK